MLYKKGGFLLHLLLDTNIQLNTKHNSSNQLKFGNGRAYRSNEYRQNANEMIQEFMKSDFVIPEKVPLGVYIKYFYPRPKKGGLPITRHTKDLDSTKSVLDSLMKAGSNLNLKNGINKPMFDDSQVVMEVLEKDYWDNPSHGLKVQVIEIHEDDSLDSIKKQLGE